MGTKEVRASSFCAPAELRSFADRDETHSRRQGKARLPGVHADPYCILYDSSSDPLHGILVHVDFSLPFGGRLPRPRRHAGYHRPVRHPPLTPWLCAETAPVVGKGLGGGGQCRAAPAPTPAAHCALVLYPGCPSGRLSHTLTQAHTDHVRGTPQPETETGSVLASCARHRPARRCCPARRRCHQAIACVCRGPTPPIPSALRQAGPAGRRTAKPSQAKPSSAKQGRAGQSRAGQSKAQLS